MGNPARKRTATRIKLSSNNNRLRSITHLLPQRQCHVYMTFRTFRQLRNCKPAKKSKPVRKSKSNHFEAFTIILI